MLNTNQITESSYCEEKCDIKALRTNTRTDCRNYVTEKLTPFLSLLYVIIYQFYHNKLILFFWNKTINYEK